MFNTSSTQGSAEGEDRRIPGRLFALIIGINDYAWYPFRNLGGAIDDANAMKQFLKDTLHVAEDHIIALYDGQATRKAIINAFRQLQYDRRINKGDPILIFYAGHGGELTAPPSWLPHNRIQCLVPQDYAPAGTKPVPGREPIPDRTIGALLEDLAEAKGNNITVIFDCCHSGSGTRDLDAECIPRSVMLDQLDIPDTLDANIWKGRVGTTPGGFAYHGPPRSHVLLAACGENEKAYERNGRGQFTIGLLKALKNCSRDNELTSLTYVQLLERIRLKRPDVQHPRCEGLNQHRLLFSGRFSADREVYYSVVRKGGRQVIDAGLAHGVSRGVTFTFYDDKKTHALGVIQVEEDALIQDFKTTLSTSIQLAGVSFAKLSGVGKLPLYVHPGNLSLALNALRHVDGSGTDAQIFRLVGASEAKLEVAVENGLVAFKVLDRRVKHFGLRKLPHKATCSSVTHVLAAAAHYYWFLDLTKKPDEFSAAHPVSIDFYRLNIDYDDWGEPVISPHGRGLCRKEPSLGNSDVIDFVVDPDAYYGMNITNNTPWNLYLNVFLFNNSSLGIVPYYTQSPAGKSEAPLKPGGSFSIGYGTETCAFRYELEPNQHVDVGYLKLFFATWPINLSDIAQLSPFASGDARDDETPKTSGWVGVVKTVSKLLTVNRKSEVTDTWFTVDVPVVQRRCAGV